KALPALALVALCACGDTTPKKTNVLNRNTSKSPATKPQPRNNQQPNQTVFTKPEQVTRNSRTETKTDAANNRTEREKETPAPPSENTDAAAYTYRSPQYYKRITDSIQYYAKPSYEKTIDEIINQISQNPAQKKNPAVNSQWYASVNFNIRKPNF